LISEKLPVATVIVDKSNNGSLKARLILGGEALIITLGWWLG